MKKTAFLLLVSFLAVFFVSADTVVFPNGDAWEGTILTMDAEHIVFQIEGGARFNLRRGDILAGFFTRTEEAAAAAERENLARDRGEWDVILEDDFSSSASAGRWRDVSSRFGDGKAGIVNFSGGKALRAVRGNTHYGFAEADVNIRTDNFDMSWETEGVHSRDNYNRGAVYFADREGNYLFSLVPDNYSKKITLYSYYTDSTGKQSATVIGEASYTADDGRHTYRIRREVFTYTVYVDGRQVLRGTEEGEVADMSIQKIILMGRGSFSGSGLYYDNLVVKAP